MDTFDGLSQQDSACFIVDNSQLDESPPITTTGQMLERLPALRQSEPRRTHNTEDRLKLKQGTEPPHALTKMPMCDRKSLGRQAPGGNSSDNMPDATPADGDTGGGDPPTGQGGSDSEGGAGDSRQGATGGAGGGDGGQGPPGRGSQEQQQEEETDEEEEVAEPPSSSESAGSIPQLVSVQPSSSTATPPRALPRHYTAYQLSSARGQEASGNGHPLHLPRRVNGESGSEEAGGISDASTAVVSDTDGHGQVLQSRAPEGNSALNPGTRPPIVSPARSPGFLATSISPRAAREVGHESSAVSTLSSYASSSSSDCAVTDTSPRKSGASNLLSTSHAKRRRFDPPISSTSVAAVTTTSASHVTSHDTSDDEKPADDSQDSSWNTIRDTSGDTRRDTSGDVSSSQQDMFAEEPTTNRRPEEDLPPVLTPSHHLASLQFSGERTSPPTDEHVQSLGYVPASQETYSSSVPLLIPSSPTEFTQDEYGSQRFRAALGGVRKVTARQTPLEVREDRARMPPPRPDRPGDLPALDEPPRPGKMASAGQQQSLKDSSGTVATKTKTDKSSSSSAEPSPTASIPIGGQLGSISCSESDVGEEHSGRQGSAEREASGQSGVKQEATPIKGPTPEAESQAWDLHLPNTELQSPAETEIDFPRLNPCGKKPGSGGLLTPFPPSPQSVHSATEPRETQPPRALAEVAMGEGALGKATPGEGTLGKGASGDGALRKGALGKGVSEKGTSGEGMSGKGALGKDAQGRGTLGKGALGEGLSGKGASREDTPGQGSLGKGSSRKGALRKGESGEDVPGKGVTGKDATGKDAPGKGAMGKGATGKDAPGKGALRKGASGGGVSAKDTLGKGVLGEDALGKGATGKDMPGKGATGKGTPGQGASGEGALGEHAPGKGVLGEGVLGKGGPGKGAPRLGKMGEGAPTDVDSDDECEADSIRLLHDCSGEDTEVESRAAGLEHSMEVEEPEMARMISVQDEDDDVGLSQELALHVSQSQCTTQFTQNTQHTQSQFDVGVTGLLSRLDTSQDADDGLKKGENGAEKRTDGVQTPLAARVLPAASSQLGSQQSQQSQQAWGPTAVTSQPRPSTRSHQQTAQQSHGSALTLGMVDTQDEDDNTQMSVPIFQLSRPCLETAAETQESEQVTSSSVFHRARQVHQKQPGGPGSPESTEDPFTFTSQSCEQSAQAEKDDKLKRRSKRQTASKSKTPTTDQNPYDDDTEEEDDDDVIMTGGSTKRKASGGVTSGKVKRTAHAVLVPETNPEQALTAIKPLNSSEDEKRRGPALVLETQQEGDVRRSGDAEVRMAVTTMDCRGAEIAMEVDNKDGEGKDGGNRAKGGHSQRSLGNPAQKDPTRKKEATKPKEQLMSSAPSSQELPQSLQKSVIAKRSVSAPRSQSRSQPKSQSRSQPKSQSRSQPKSQPRSQPKSQSRSQPSSQPKSQSRSHPKSHSSQELGRIELSDGEEIPDSNESGIIPPTGDESQVKKSSRGDERPAASSPSKGDAKGSVKKQRKPRRGSATSAKDNVQAQPEVKALWSQETLRPRMSGSSRTPDSEHEQVTVIVQRTKSEVRETGLQAPGSEAGKDTMSIATLLSADAMSGAAKAKRTSVGATIEAGRETPATGQGSCVDTSQLGTVLHFTTITTVMHHTVQIMETVVNGRTIAVKSFDPVIKTVEVIREVHKDHVTDVSPSRSVQSLTSGDLGDISSLSKSNSTKTSSTLTSPHDLLRTSSSGSGSGMGSSRLEVRTGIGRSMPSSRFTMVDAQVQTSISEQALGRRSVDSLLMMDSLPEVPSVQMPPPRVMRTSSSGSSIKVADLASLSGDADVTIVRRRSAASSGTNMSSHRQSSSLFSTSVSSEPRPAEKSPLGPDKQHPASAGGADSVKHGLFQKPKPRNSGTPKSRHLGSVTPLSRVGEQTTPGGEDKEPTAAGEDTLQGVKKDVEDPADRSRGKMRTRDKGRPRGRGRGRTLVPVSQPGGEEDLADQTEPPNRAPPGPSVTTEDEEVPRQLTDGERVFALWGDDGHFYHGQLRECVSGAACSVKFADGNISDVPRLEVFPSALLRPGIEVLAQRRSVGLFDNAVVVSRAAKSKEPVYEVQFKDSVKKKVSVRKLCLTQEQASILKEQFEQLQQEPTLKSEGRLGSPTATLSKAGTPVRPPPTSSPPALIQPTDKAVYAIFKDRHYYPGYMVTEELGGKFTIAYEDGDVHSVRDIFIIHLALLPIGQAVLAERVGEDASVPGVIAQVFDEPKDSWGYLVDFTDGDRERLHRSKVILTHEQAMTLKASTPTLSSTPKISDVTLDNLVAGKRRRHLPSPRAAPAPVVATPVGRASPSTVRPSRRIHSSTASKKAAKRPLVDLEPSAKSTPTPKAKRRALMSEEAAGDAPSPITFESPITIRKSPRKELFSKVLGPVPKKGSKLFNCICFLLTSVEKTPKQKMEERLSAKSADSADTTSEGSVEEEEIRFDKNHLHEQVEAGGGHVLEHFNKDQLKLYRKCFLVSDSHHRTLKYFFSLAANIPCVSHIWVRDSCATGVLQDYKNYILPAGISLETKLLVEARLNPVQPLCSMHVIVITMNARFQTMWSEILRTAGCHVHNTMPEEVFHTVDVMVTDRQVSDAVLVEVLQADVPVVSSEWVIQSLISGRRASYTAHGRYRHDYEEPSPKPS